MRDSNGNRSHDSLLARVRAQGYARLRFPEPLETEFRSDQVTAAVRWVRLCLLVAIGTSLGFSAIDHWVIHANNAIPDLVRYGLQLPVLVICLYATLRPSFMPWYPLAIQIGGPLYGFGTVLLVAYAESDHTALVGSRLLLVNFFIFFMSGLRLPQALRCNLLILAALIAAGLSGMIPAAIATYLSFAVIIANVIGTAGLYSLEHANRTSFLERRLLREIAEQDGLTRLLNRQSFDTRARARWRDSSARNLPLTVLMVDVDNFKQYNDRYGHQAGDDCLQQVAAAVRRAVGGGDVVARYGGEEFIALLGIGAQAAPLAAERVVAEVAALAIPHAGNGGHPHVSVSVGAASTDRLADSSYEALTRLADRALYDAKESGRNRCVVLQP